MLGNKIKPIKGGMVGQRINLDPTELLNNAMSPAQAQGPRLLGPNSTQGPTLFDPTVGINLNQANAARQAGMMGSIGSIGMGNAQPMRQPQGPRSMIGRGGRGRRGSQPRMTPRQVRSSRAMGRGSGAFGMQGRGPIALQQPKARGRGRGKRR